MRLICIAFAFFLYTGIAKSSEISEILISSLDWSEETTYENVALWTKGYRLENAYLLFRGEALSNKELSLQQRVFLMALSIDIFNALPPSDRDNLHPRFQEAAPLSEPIENQWKVEFPQ